MCRWNPRATDLGSGEYMINTVLMNNEMCVQRDHFDFEHAESGVIGMAVTKRFRCFRIVN